jgi:hypothetical protein
LCTYSFPNQDAFRKHVEDIHKDDFTVAQIETVVATAARSDERPSEQEVCPLCHTQPAKTKRAFASHVGKHLQEISLASIPVSETADDDESIPSNESDRSESSSEAMGKRGSQNTLGAPADEEAVDSIPGSHRAEELETTENDFDLDDNRDFIAWRWKNASESALEELSDEGMFVYSLQSSSANDKAHFQIDKLLTKFMIASA